MEDALENQEVTSQLFLDDFPLNMAGECEFSRNFETALYQHNLHLTVGSASLTSFILGAITAMFQSTVVSEQSIDKGTVFVEPDRILFVCPRTIGNHGSEASVFIFQGRTTTRSSRISMFQVEILETKWPEIDMKSALGRTRFVEITLPNVQYAIAGPQGPIHAEQGTKYRSPFKVMAYQKNLMVDDTRLMNFCQFYLEHIPENVVHETDFLTIESMPPKFVSKLTSSAYSVFSASMSDFRSASNIIYFVAGAMQNFVKKHSILVKTRNWWHSTGFLQDLTIVPRKPIGIFVYQKLPVLLTAIFSKVSMIPREIRTEYDHHVHCYFDQQVRLQSNTVRNHNFALPQVLLVPAPTTKKLDFVANLVKYTLEIFDEHSIAHYIYGQLVNTFDDSATSYLVQPQHKNEHVNTFLIQNGNQGTVINVKDVFFQHTRVQQDIDQIQVDKRLLDHLNIDQLQVYNIEARRQDNEMVLAEPWHYMDRKFFNSASPNDEFKGDVLYTRYPLLVDHIPGSSTPLTQNDVSEHLQPILDPGLVPIYLSNNPKRVKTFIKRLIRNANKVRPIETQIQLNAVVEGATSTFVQVLQPPFRQTGLGLMGLIRKDMLYRNALDSWQTMILLLKFGPHNSIHDVADLMTDLRDIFGSQTHQPIEHALEVNVVRYQDGIRIRSCFVDM